MINNGIEEKRKFELIFFFDFSTSIFGFLSHDVHTTSNYGHLYALEPRSFVTNQPCSCVELYTLETCKNGMGL